MATVVQIWLHKAATSCTAVLVCENLNSRSLGFSAQAPFHSHTRGLLNCALGLACCAEGGCPGCKTPPRLIPRALAFASAQEACSGHLQHSLGCGCCCLFLSSSQSARSSVRPAASADLPCWNASSPAVTGTSVTELGRRTSSFLLGGKLRRRAWQTKCAVTVRMAAIHSVVQGVLTHVMSSPRPRIEEGQGAWPLLHRGATLGATVSLRSTAGSACDPQPE